MTSAQAKLLSLALLNEAQEAEANGDKEMAAKKGLSAQIEYANAALLYRLAGVANDFAKALEPKPEPTPDGPHLTDEEGWRDQQRERRAE